MEELNSSLLLFHTNSSKDAAYPDNVTLSSNGSLGAMDPVLGHNFYEIKRMIYLVVLPIFIILGSVGNILTFIVMQRGSLREVSTCFYMSILALADTGR